MFTAFWVLGRTISKDKGMDGYLSICTAFVISMALEGLIWAPFATKQW